MRPDPFDKFSLEEEGERKSQIEDYVLKLLDVIRAKVDVGSLKGVLGPLSLVILLHWATHSETSGSDYSLDQLFLPGGFDWESVVDGFFRNEGEVKELVQLLSSRGIQTRSADTRGEEGKSEIPLRNVTGRDKYLRILDTWVSSFDLDQDHGWELLREAFEILIKQVAEGSRGAGMFSTPGGVVDFMLDLADPGEEEHIYDPCYGTGGLLAGVLDRCSQLSATDSNSGGSVIYGIEINPVLHVVGATRIILAGAHSPKLKRADALRTDPINTRGRETGFDVVLANPPFGGGPIGGEYDFDDYPVRARNKESAFVQHALLSLCPGGRAVIVVPEGILFRAYDRPLRKLLAEEYCLEGVIGLPEETFQPYTSLPAAILNVRRQEPRDHVWFVSPEASSVKRRGTRSKEGGIDLIEAEDLPSDMLAAGKEESSSADRDRRRADDEVFQLSRRVLASRDYNLIPKPTGDRALKSFLSETLSLPDIREKCELAEIAHVFSGFQYRSDDLVEDEDSVQEKSGIRFLRVGNIQEGYIEPSSTCLTKAAEEKIEVDARLQTGDVLLTVSGSVGRAAVVTSEYEGDTVTHGVIVIRPREELLGEYIQRLLSSSVYQDWLEGHSYGGTIQHLRITDLRSLEVPLPPEDIQKEVALAFDPAPEPEKILHILSGKGEETPILDFLQESAALEELVDQLPELESGTSRNLQVDSGMTEGMISSLVRVRDRLQELAHKLEGKVRNDDVYRWAVLVISQIQELSAASSLNQEAEKLAYLGRLDIDSLNEAAEDLPEVIQKRAFSVSQTLNALGDIVRENTYDKIALRGSVEPDVISSEEPSLLTVSLVNRGPVTVREVHATFSGLLEIQDEKRALSNVVGGNGRSQVELLQPGESVDWEIEPPRIKPGTYQLEIRWRARRLDGEPLRGKTEVVYEVSESDEKDESELNNGIGDNPYIVATPVDSTERPEMFKGREEMIEEIKGSLQTYGPNTVLLLEGNRRTGKTSILRRLEHPHVLSENWIPVYCNFQEGSGDRELAGLEAGEIFYRVGRELVLKTLERGYTVDILGSGVLSPDDKRYQVRKSLMKGMRPNFEDSPNAFESLEVTVEAVRHAVGDRRLLFMLDEFDKVLEGLDSGLTKQTVPENFRSLFHDHKGISGIITGSRRIRRLREEKYSALFGIGLHIPVKALDEKAAIKLVNEPVQGQLRYTKEARSMVVEECACQPYLIQYLCHTIFQTCKREEVRAVSPEIVDKAATDLVQDNEHFRHLWDEAGTDRKRYLVCLIDRLSEDERVTYDLLSEYLGSQGISTQGLDGSLEGLLEREIISRDEVRPGVTEYQLEVPLFSRWISSNEDESIYKERILEVQDH